MARGTGLQQYYLNIALGEPAKRQTTERTEHMSLIASFAKIAEESRTEYEKMKEAVLEPSLLEPSEFESTSLEPSELIGELCKRDNILAFCDNGAFMRYLRDSAGMRGKVKLIYIDPPFFSKSNYKATLSVSVKGSGSAKEKKVRQLAYEDIWEKGMEDYLKMVATRLLFIKDLLAEDGTVWVHLDWHSVHYVKILLDEIFGDDNFINEIIWQYKSGGSTKKHFARKHDNILVYGKSPKYYLKLPKEKSYNRGLKPYKFKGVEEFCDDIGWYTMVNMKDVWNIDMVGRTSRERTGYATQKPEALLERIIEAASCEGDIIGDFFCGSGTLAAAASKLGRKWLCCDSSPVAIASCLKRFLGEEMEFSFLIEEGRAGEIEIRESEDKKKQIRLFPDREQKRKSEKKSVKKSYTINI